MLSHQVSSKVLSIYLMIRLTTTAASVKVLRPAFVNLSSLGESKVLEAQCFCEGKRWGNLGFIFM